MKSQQVNQNKLKHIKIDPELHRLLKIKAAQEKTSIRTLVEGLLADLLGIGDVN